MNVDNDLSINFWFINWGYLNGYLNGYLQNEQIITTNHNFIYELVVIFLKS